MNLQEVGWEVEDWIDLALDKKMKGSREYGNEVSGAMNSGEFLDWVTNY
jgi:hypothetical protein